jgi:hypothetical protein
VYFPGILDMYTLAVMLFYSILVCIVVHVICMCHYRDSHSQECRSVETVTKIRVRPDGREVGPHQGTFEQQYIIMVIILSSIFL